MEDILLHLSRQSSGLRRDFAEASVPFPEGALRQPAVRVLDARDRVVPVQSHALATWPAGSVKWLHLVCETRARSGPLRLAPAEAEEGNATSLAREEDGAVVIDNGRLSWSIPTQLPVPLEECVHGVLTGLSLSRGRRRVPVTGCSQHAGLLITDADGKLYGTSRSRTSLKVRLHHTGPLKATVLIEGRPSRSAHESLMACRLRLDVWRRSPVVRLAVTWLNPAEEDPAFLRDIRFRLPLAFGVESVSLGCEHGTCSAPITGDEEVYLLQDDADRYWAMRTGWGGDDVDLASGGASGRHSPGWLVARGEGRAVAVHVPRFREEYPNEIAVRSREVSVGLWPARASEAIAGRHRQLPRGPAEAPYRRGAYDSIMVQPYWAFIDGERQCLEVIPGLARTQEILFDFDPPDDERFGRQVASGGLSPDRATVNPGHVAEAGVFGRAAPAGGAGFEEVDQMLSRVLDWFERHMRGGWTWGKFDYGDLRYIVYPPDSRMPPTYRGTERGPRAGYWNNNENDPLQGLLVHHYLTGDPRAWDLASAAARHLLDVDVRHGRDTGMYTHSFGHCYRAMGYRSMDHLWLDGLAAYVSASDDPFAAEDLEGLRAMALAEFQTRPFAEDNLRNFVLGITMNLMFYETTHEREHLEAALRVARDLMGYQAEEGYFPNAGPRWAAEHRAGEGFPGEFSSPSTLSELHTLEALHRLHQHSRDEAVRESFLRLAGWYVEYDLHSAGDAVRLYAMPRGEPNPRGTAMFRSGDFFCLPSLAYAYELTRDRQFAVAGARILRNLCQTQLAGEDHPLWNGVWFEHAGVAEATGERTVPQRHDDPEAVFNYITPLSASFALYKTRDILWAIRDAGLVSELNP